jgi:hypothetical protein
MLLVGESLKKGDNFNVHELNYFRESIQFHNIHADALNFIPKLRCSNNIPYLYWSQNNSWNMSINVSDVQITITRLNRASPI